VDVADLLAELANGPDLHGAACVRPYERGVFDRVAVSTAAAAVEDALAVCAGCPVLAECQAWVLSLRPRKRPGPVVGGMIVTQRTVRLPRPRT
jgi:Transcription factor WhiB